MIDPVFASRYLVSAVSTSSAPVSTRTNKRVVALMLHFPPYIVPCPADRCTGKGGGKESQRRIRPHQENGMCLMFSSAVDISLTALLVVLVDSLLPAHPLPWNFRKYLFSTYTTRKETKPPWLFANGMALEAPPRVLSVPLLLNDSEQGLPGM